jgi:hypothetical protein
MPGKPTRSLAKASVLAACIAFAIPAAAHGEPSASAQVGEAFSYTGVVYDNIDPNRPLLIVDPDHDKCGGLTTGVHWGDFGALTPVPYPAQSSLVSVPGGWNAVVSASYTYKAPKNTGGASVDLSITCDGVESGDIYLPWVNVTVTGASGGGSLPPGSPPPDSCPLGQTTAQIRISQAYCAPQAFFQAEDKWAFRKLANLYYHGYVVDKAIDDFISKWTGETWFTENIPGKGNILWEFVIGKLYGEHVIHLDRLVLDKLPKSKFIPYSWILDAPKYASWLDYVKYAVLTRLADDPPDPNFTALASTPKLRGLRGAPRQVGDRDRREAALYIALLTTVERAAGAEAAGATTAQRAQLRHASGIANQLVSLLGAKQRALKAAARTVKRIRAGRLPRSVVRRAKRRLDPRSLTPALRKLGFTADEIASVGESVPSVPLERLTAPFQDLLGLGAEARTVRAERAALATFANRHARGG